MAESGERWRLISAAVKRYLQAHSVRMIIITDLECLPCVRHCQALYSPLIDSVSSLHNPVHSTLAGKHWFHEQNHSVNLTKVYSLHRAVHTCLAGRKVHNASSVPGIPLALPWKGMIEPPLLSALLREQDRAQLGGEICC